MGRRMDDGREKKVRWDSYHLIPNASSPTTKSHRHSPALAKSEMWGDHGVETNETRTIVDHADLVASRGNS